MENAKVLETRDSELHQALCVFHLEFHFAPCKVPCCSILGPICNLDVGLGENLNFMEICIAGSPEIEILNYSIPKGCLQFIHISGGKPKPNLFAYHFAGAGG